MPGAQAVTMKGREAHKQRLKKLSGPAIIKAAGRVLYVGADMIRAEARRSITTGSVSGMNHIPSSPGQAPNNDTGVLANFIETELVGPLEATVTSSGGAQMTDGGEFGPGRSKAGSAFTYAAALEFGTSRMAARPYMRPARDKKAPEIQRLFETEIDKLVKGSGT